MTNYRLPMTQFRSEEKSVVSFGRAITAMITPFKEDGSVNYAVAEKLAAYLAENGSDIPDVRNRRSSPTGNTQPIRV